MVERYLDCSNPRCGLARIRCADHGEEHLLMFSCPTWGSCASCHAKRLEGWDEWMREELPLDVPHRQVIFTTPTMARIFFKYNRRLLELLRRCAPRSIIRYFEFVARREVMPGVIAAFQTFRARMNFHPYLRSIVTDPEALPLRILEEELRPLDLPVQDLLDGLDRRQVTCTLPVKLKMNRLGPDASKSRPLGLVSRQFVA